MGCEDVVMLEGSVRGQGDSRRSPVMASRPGCCPAPALPRGASQMGGDGASR